MLRDNCRVYSLYSSTLLKSLQLLPNARQRCSGCCTGNPISGPSKGSSFVFALSQEEEEVRQVVAVMYVQGLEEKLRRLGRAAGVGGQNAPHATEATAVLDSNPPFRDFEVPETATVYPECSSHGIYRSEVANASTIADNIPPIQDPLVSPRPTSSQTSTFGQQLTALSLEATAERHLGSTTGLSFAELTQMVLRRLTPDKADFVFNSHQDNTTGANPLDLSFPADPFNDSFFQNLSESISVHPLLFGDLFLPEFTGSDAPLGSLVWPADETYVRRLVDFYFAHSHTLYPIMKRSEIMDVFEKIHQNPQSLATQAPLDIFRIWMVLAIGSTAYSSVTLSGESESMMFYNNALQYSDQALGGDEMVYTPVYYFSAEENPTDESLVCLGGYNAPSLLFFFQSTRSYVVSITLGRPFALHDDDIDVTPFEDADEEYIHSDCIGPQNSLQPSMMAVPLHILSLRRIAGKISRQVYGNFKNSKMTLQEREAIIASLHQELLAWRRGMPFPLPDIDDRVPHLNTTWYDFNYYTHLAMIYRPSPLFPVSDVKRIKMLETAASMSLRQAFSMHQQRRFAYNWLNFLALFTATLSLVYAITAQPDDLGVVLRDTRAIADLDLATQLFETLGLKFVAAKKIQGMIAEISRRYKEVRASKTMEPNMGYRE
ncbi:hypothetical protein N7497_002755 [Penicillium chrysogenum]|uniref:Transcription factor domain-containing protein n=1 Tax=Penicillium chrysogenum TaxID=5076 RepID=A0ABQ8W0G4_PENCH|nr:hypothetical protein N7505_012069 [Penicillium chrysogenum]KAJ6162776.1 hypothetical protein N7497_002755 [Penicillium chrysogenum]